MSISVNTANKDEIFINYRSSDDPNDVVWSRPLEDFLSMIDLDGTSIPKFNLYESRSNTNFGSE